MKKSDLVDLCHQPPSSSIKPDSKCAKCYTTSSTDGRAPNEGIASAGVGKAQRRRRPRPRPSINTRPAARILRKRVRSALRHLGTCLRTEYSVLRPDVPIPVWRELLNCFPSFQESASAAFRSPIMSTQDHSAILFDVCHDQQVFRLLELPPALLEAITSSHPPRYISFS